MPRHAFDTFDLISYLGGEFVQNWIKQGSFAWRQLVEQIERNLWELGDNVHFLKSGWRHSLHSSFRSKHSGHCDCCPSLITHNMRTSVNTRGFCFFYQLNFLSLLARLAGQRTLIGTGQRLVTGPFAQRGVVQSLARPGN